MTESVRHDLARYSSSGFDRGASRGKELLWVLVRCLFFESAWPWPSSLRVFWLRLFGARVGRGCVIRSRVHISFPWRLRLGDHVWMGEGVFVLSLAEVEMGDHVCVSQRAFLCTGAHDHRRESFDLRTAPIRIGPHAWVAAHAILLPGVTIGEGAVVGAGSVVKRDVPPFVIVEGNPAAPVGLRTPRQA
jgi:putative colanic acid biosynthesis acetyltransferase WcaF